MNVDRWWALSAILCGLSVIVMAANSRSGHTFPDWLIRISGIFGLAALAVLAYTTVKKTKKK